MSLFSKTFTRKPPRSKKNLSHSSILTNGFGRIVPVNFEELMPNDVILQNVRTQIKPVPLFAPAYSKIYVNTRTFACPVRIIFPNYEEYWSQSDDTVKEPYTTLKDLANIHLQGDMTLSPFLDGSLGDYMGLPTLPYSGTTYDGQTANAGELATSLTTGSPELAAQPILLLKLLAYHKVWCDWYRDENYDDDQMEQILKHLPDCPDYPYIKSSDTITLDDGSTVQPLRELFDYHYASGPKDYFLSALPSQQQGTGVTIPLGEKAPVYGDQLSGSPFQSVGVRDLQVVVRDVNSPHFKNSSLSGTNENQWVMQYTGQTLAGVDLFADLSQAQAANVVEFRTALAAQKYEEKLMRGGSRFAEVMRSRFNSRIPDAYIQRSQYIGGSRQFVEIDDIFSTAQTDGSDAQAGMLGSYAGRAYSAGNTGYQAFHTMEHSIIVTLQTIIPQPIYAQGIQRDLMRTSFWDKAQWEFAKVGEQEIKSLEFYLPVDSTAVAAQENDSIFGYTPRYSDWCTHKDEIHGDFRDSLGYWHTAAGMSHDATTYNVELNSDILRQNYYKGASRLFAVVKPEGNPWQDLPFRCKVDVLMNKICSLPKNPAPNL